MNFPTEKEINQLKKDYPKGTRVQLIYMDDPYAPPRGTKGTVKHIDGAGNIHVSWDNGSGLSLIYEVDIFRVIGK